MPNHIQNRLTVIGSDRKVIELLNSISSKDSEGELMQIDFNKIKPMPEDLNVSPHSGIENAVKIALKMPLADNALIAGLESMSRQKNKSPLEFLEDDWNTFIKCLNNVRKHGFMSWYEWSIENWGTKWNAYGQNDKRNTEDTIYFQTAWSSPVNLILELSKKFPDVTLLLAYADEDSGSNTGRIEMKAGRFVKKLIPKNQSNEAFQICFELDPDSEKYFELIDGKYTYKEEA